MKIEKQVCSLELAKQLDALGVKQESLFWWHYIDEYAYSVKFITSRAETSGTRLYSAFTASELANMLPIYIDTKQNEPFNSFRFYMQTATLCLDGEFKKTYIINYECDTCTTQGIDAFVQHKLGTNIYSDNLADALAKMLIYLHEKELVEINNTLK